MRALPYNPVLRAFTETIMKRCWANLLFLALVAVLGVGAMLAGCGQKGPLYLPDEGAQQPNERTGRD